MTVGVVKFSPAVALVAIMKIVRDATDNLYMTMKMIYVADKMHFKKTGRFMFGDEYWSMEAGATPSGAYDLIKFVRGDGADIGFPDAKLFISVDADIHKITLLKDVPEGRLSEFVRQCLDSVISDHTQNNRTFSYWWRLAHDGAWESARDGSSGETVKMDEREIAKTIPENDELLALLDDPEVDRC